MCEEKNLTENEEQVHDHEHEHCCGHHHDHDHEHEHHHDHEHEHEHCCEHHHDHDHEHAEESADSDDTQEMALVKYMIHHNEHHAEEIEEMAETLRKGGNTAAAEELEKGIEDFNTGNAHLSKAYYMLKGEI